MWLQLGAVLQSVSIKAPWPGVASAVTMLRPGSPLTLASLAAVLALAPAPATAARSSLASPREVDI